MAYISQYPPAQNSTYVKATSHISSNFWEYFATDPTKSLIGGTNENEWTSNLAQTNQRFHIDLGEAKTIVRIYYENSHQEGTYIVNGVRNFTFWGSLSASAFEELTYATNTDWVQLATSTSMFDEHNDIHSDWDTPEELTADPKYITVTNTTPYRYYAFKFADNYGSYEYMGVRRIELQNTTDTNPVSETLNFTLETEPPFTNFTPSAGYAGDEVIVEHDTFGITDLTRILFFNNMEAITLSYTTSSMTVTVPPGSMDGAPKIVEEGKDTYEFSTNYVLLSPYIISVTPSSGYPEDEITIVGKNLAYASSINFDNIPAETVSNDYLSTMVVKVPSGSTGIVPMSISSYITEPSRTYPNFNIFAFDVESLTPDNGYIGDTVTISGNGFDENVTVDFNGAAAVIDAYTSTTITTSIPSAATSGPVTITRGEIQYSSPFTMNLQLISVNPSAGYVGDEVVITGEGFDATTTVTFNGSASATISEYTSTTLTTTVPDGATSGPITVTEGAHSISTSFDFAVGTTDRYWVGNSGNWSDNSHWSYTSGGSGGAEIPTSRENIYFNSNSFSSISNVVTVDVAGNFNVGTITETCSGFTMNINDTLTCHGGFYSYKTDIYINGRLIMLTSCSFKGYGYVEELYCYPETVLQGTNTIDTLMYDTNNIDATFWVEAYSNQSIRELSFINVARDAQATIRPKYISNIFAEISHYPPSLWTYPEDATLTWSTTGADLASIDQGVGSVALSGSTVVSVTQSTVYTITAIGEFGIVTASTSVGVADFEYNDMLKVMDVQPVSGSYGISAPTFSTLPEYVFSIQLPLSLTISHEAGSKVELHYTINDGVPTSASSLYTTALTVSSGAFDSSVPPVYAVKAVAYAPLTHDYSPVSTTQTKLIASGATPISDLEVWAIDSSIQMTNIEPVSGAYIESIIIWPVNIEDTAASASQLIQMTNIEPVSGAWWKSVIEI